MEIDAERHIETIFPRELERELWSHPGKWVAIVDDRIFAVGDTLLEVVTRAQHAGHSEPMVYKVPLPGTTYFYEVALALA